MEAAPSVHDAETQAGRCTQYSNIVWLVDQSILQTWGQLAPQCSTSAVAGRVARGVSVLLIIMSRALLLDSDRYWKQSRIQVPLEKHQTSYLVAYCDALKWRWRPGTVWIPLLKRACLPHQRWLMRAREVQPQVDSLRSVVSVSALFVFLVVGNEVPSLLDNGGSDSGKRCEGSHCVSTSNGALNAGRLWPWWPDSIKSCWRLCSHPPLWRW